jgi:hypothetical protein
MPAPGQVNGLNNPHHGRQQVIRRRADCAAGDVASDRDLKGESLGAGNFGGAACVTRTRDPRITNAVLYQLS